MRITHVVESLERGGLERVVLNLLKCQIEDGDKCQVICVFRGGELLHEAESLGVKCVILNKKKGLSIQAIIALRSSLRAFKTDVVHTHNALSHYFTYFACVGLKYKCFINTRHGMAALDNESRREKLFNLTASKTNYIVSVCNVANKIFKKHRSLPEGKCVVVHNGIQVENFLNKSSHSSEKAKKDEFLRLGTVGRLNWAKDYFTLLNAYALIDKEHNGIKLIIVGGGELEGELKAHAKKLGIDQHIEFKGDVDDVKSMLDGLDIYISSSVTEGYSISLLEACAAGKPIVATDVGGTVEIVKNGINGFVVPASNEIELSKCISELINNSALRKIFSRNSLDWAKKNASSATMADKYKQLYKNCF